MTTSELQKSFSGELLSRRIALAPRLRFAISRMAMSSLGPRQVLQQYLVEVYHYVKHSCPLMELAKNRLGSEHSGLRDYLDHHIGEEKGHEKWALQDLETLGVSRATVENSLPSKETIALVGSQLYVIQNLHPIGFLGYIFALESLPPTAETIEQLSQRFEVSTDALTVFSGHAEADPGHMEDLSATIDKCVVDVEHQQLVRRNLEITIDNLADLMLAVGMRQ